MNHIARLYWTAKGVGWQNVPRRLLQAWRRRSGWLRRRLDPGAFTDEAFRQECGASLAHQTRLWADRAKRFFSVPSREDLARAADDALWRDRVEQVCQKALEGEYLFFSRWYGQLGWPLDFNRDPMHDLQWETGRHWLDGPDSLGGKADIKLVWEASRFSLAYYFARAYARDREEKWAEAFWQMFDAWIEQNPPQLTVAWGCGQEITFRLMSMLFAAVTTLHSPAATPERLFALSRLAWQSGKQILININHARSQQNNHGISEAVGLWTIGVLFPEFAGASRWRDRGRKVLVHEIGRQVYRDGSFVQHSTNYHRVLMDDLLWALRLSETASAPLPKIVLDLFERAAGWLGELIDPESGRVPNYGSNDGALVLPLSCCDYLDYRPVAQAAEYLLHRKRRFAPGPWDETMAWLFGPESLDASASAPARSPAHAAGDGGYYILRGENSWCMIRCHTYRHRPCQADMLHVDLWYKGVNVLRDAGTYMYYCEEPWRRYFPSTAAHNTVQVDGRDQMVKGPRFLWFRWTRSRVLRFETAADGRTGCFEGEHYGYTSLPEPVVHRRCVCRIGDGYAIVDDVLGTGRHHIALRWRLCSADWQQDRNTWQAEIAGRPFVITVHGPGVLPVGASPDFGKLMSETHESLYYGERSRGPAIECAARAALPVRFVTTVGEGVTSFVVDDRKRRLRVEFGGGRSIDLSAIPGDNRPFDLPLC